MKYLELFASNFLTKKSIIFAWCFFIVGLIFILIKNGFSILSLCLLMILLLLCCFYTVWTLLSYKVFPRNKSKNMGILLYINAKSKADFLYLKKIIIDNFEKLSSSMTTNKVEVILLSYKNVEYIKGIREIETQKKLLEKCHCITGLFLFANDCGRGNVNYELQINAGLIHPILPKYINDILQNNFTFIFNGCYLNKFNKTNDYEELKKLSNKMFFICQLIVAVTHRYSGYLDFGINVLHELLLSVQKVKVKEKFFENLSKIIKVELCAACLSVSHCEYSNYIYTGKYNYVCVDKYLKILKDNCYSLNIIEFIIGSHLNKAISYFFQNKIVEAKGIINKLDNEYKNILPNNKPWGFSSAFLFAVSAQPKEYLTIIDNYELLKNNTAYNVKEVHDFTNKYYDLNPKNVGVAIALFALYAFRSDVKEYFSLQFYNELLLMPDIKNNVPLLNKITTIYENNLK